MTTTHKFDDPAIILDSASIGDLFTSRTLTASDVRNSEQAQEQLRSGGCSSTFLRGVRGLPFYYGMTNPTEESSSIAFERNFNPLMKRDSEYFKALGGVISCVERHNIQHLSDEERAMGCKDEVRKMRLAAFNNELLFHNVNKRFYMSFIQNKKVESAY